MKKKKLIFVQLPIPRLTISREDHNIPVAAFYLSSYLLEHSFAVQFEIELFDPFLQNYGSDETLLEEILQITPDVICFSLFCWNVERSLSLAEQIRQHTATPHPPLILAGGPEVTPDNPLLRHSAIDVYVYGEGEYTLVSLLEAWLSQADTPDRFDIPGTFSSKDGNLCIQPPQAHAIDINATNSAYLKGLVPRHAWNEMFIETIRGCPFSCRFCYYNKQCGNIRFLEQQEVLALVQYAIDQHYREIFFLDPSFNIRPDLRELLINLANINSGHQIKIAAELRADMVDEPLAVLLADAGIYEVELGLQSIHRDTMQQSGRFQQLDKFLCGTRAMLEQGIKTKVDLIVGLPGDTPEKFKASARWIKRHGLDECLQVFCLNVLPGTYFREHAGELHLNYSPLPPYYLISSPDWPEDAIKEAFSWTEDYFGVTFEPDVEEEFSRIPILSGRLQEIIVVDPSQPFTYPSSTTGMTKWIFSPIRKESDLFTHLPVIQMYTRNNPYGINRVYLEPVREISLNALFDFYAGFTSLRQQFIDRDIGILSVHDTPIYHYQIEIVITQALRHKFSTPYLDKIQTYFHLTYLP